MSGLVRPLQAKKGAKRYNVPSKTPPLTPRTSSGAHEKSRNAITAKNGQAHVSIPGMGVSAEGLVPSKSHDFIV